MVYVLIWRTCFHCIVFLHNGLQITGGSNSMPFPLLLLHAAEFLNQYPTLDLLIYKSNSFSIHCLEGAYFFLFHKEDFFFHCRRRKKDCSRKLKSLSSAFFNKNTHQTMSPLLSLLYFPLSWEWSWLANSVHWSQRPERTGENGKENREGPPANQWHPWYPTKSHITNVKYSN